MKGVLWLEKPDFWSRKPEISLPLSKSISNRILILEALSDSLIKAEKYSDANDTIVLKRILQHQEKETWNAEDAGTAFRFLTAFAATGRKAILLDGTGRMRKRPISPLAEALIQLGAEIEYKGEIGYPPLQVYPPENGLISNGKIILTDTKSSQFVSALMLIAPKIQNGIHIVLPKAFPSFEYIRMTAEIMRDAGLNLEISNTEIYIPQQAFQSKKLSVESDWSSASYFFSLFQLGSWDEMVLKNLKVESSQPDRICAEYFRQMGLVTRKEQNNLRILRSENTSQRNVQLDFSNCPDIAMTLIVSCALARKNLEVRGIKNLIYKESNRIEILRRELLKINCHFTEHNGVWHLDAAKLQIPEIVEIDPENDHRIAMAFSPLALFTKVCIKDPEVVNKSFPDFWQELEKLHLHSGNNVNQGD